MRADPWSPVQMQYYWYIFRTQYQLRQQGYLQFRAANILLQLQVWAQQALLHTQAACLSHRQFIGWQSRGVQDSLHSTCLRPDTCAVIDLGLE